MIGIIGASRTGRRVIARLVAAGHQVLLHDPCVNAKESASMKVEGVTLDELCRRSGIRSVHAPDLPETRHPLDPWRLGLIHDGGEDRGARMAGRARDQHQELYTAARMAEGTCAVYETVAR
ncbi:NAD(P)-dependent oxidoreductase [Streptosporangium brasiliense]|uniref:NAD(P)-dependent oxidoreductase n=1 Tax=Streptosporangium brasiliense TaxID=47480 RepID=UPI0027D8C678|nr:NAD(P)-dependent oxidoreductase [Streptosporangium brasiliense]